MSKYRKYLYEIFLLWRYKTTNTEDNIFEVECAIT